MLAAAISASFNLPMNSRLEHVMKSLVDAIPLFGNTAVSVSILVIAGTLVARKILRMVGGQFDQLLIAVAEKYAA